MRSSLSDTKEYLKFCTTAAKDDKLFNNFKRNEIYNDILEHVSFKQGSKYLKHIIQSHLRLKGIKKLFNYCRYLKKFKENDIIGNPRVYKYPIVGDISPTTLRYISVMLELENYFGSLDGLDICEIGGGYGGQYKLIDSYFNINKYTIIDLEPVLRLTNRFLSNFKLNSNIDLVSPENLIKNSYDLVISNYAFSELNRESQDQYIDKVIKPSKCGYIVYNDISPDYFKTYKVEEFAKLFDDVVILPERPKTGDNIRVILWGKMI